MKLWQKVALLFATPTLSVLHSRWITYLLATEWDAQAQQHAVVLMVVPTVLVAVWVVVSEFV